MFQLREPYTPAFVAANRQVSLGGSAIVLVGKTYTDAEVDWYVNNAYASGEACGRGELKECSPGDRPGGEPPIPPGGDPDRDIGKFGWLWRGAFLGALAAVVAAYFVVGPR
jgi:hypothetical protein